MKKVDRLERFLSILLTIVFVIGSITNVNAAGSLADAMKKVRLYAKGSGTQLLTWQGIISSANFAPSMIVYSEGGKEYPAYCINPNKPGVDDAGSYEVGVDDAITNPKVWGAITNGYPYKTPQELGLNSDYEAYYATKMAVWAIVHSNYSDINDWKANGSNNAHVETAMKAIYNAGMATTSISQSSASVSLTPTTTMAKVDDINDKYFSQTFTVTSSGEYSVSLNGNVPSGAKVTDEGNNAKATFQKGEKFKVLIPITGTKTGGNFNVAVTTKSNSQAILWGKSYNDNTQDYAVVSDSLSDQKAQATISYLEEPGEDDPPGKLIIKKVEAGTTKGLAGAVFRVTRADGGVVGDFITDGSGQVTVPVEKIGAYYVDEIVAPAGFQIDENSHKDIVITANEDAILTFANKPLTELLITKVDEETNEKLAGAVIRIALDGGSKHIDVQTDASGTAKVPELENGTYTVTEITAPSGYILDSTPHSIKIEAGKEAKITLSNKSKPGLLIKKFDEDTSMPLGGAEFSVAKKGGSIVYEGITGKDGTILVEGLASDWYTVTEIAAPKGYLIATTSKDVFLEPNKTTEIKFDNRLRPALQIMKVDSQTNAPLAGAKFTVKKTEGGTVSEYVTDATGTITINDLDEAIYSVEEIQAPDGYLLEPQHKDIQLEWGKTKVLVFTNKARPSLEILKVDEETKAPLEGAKFRVTTTEGNTVGEYVTDRTGRIIITGLNDEIYTIEEIVAPDGYLLETQHKDIKLEWGMTKTVVFTNKSRPALEIIKIDEETKQPLAGAKFRVTATESETVSEYVTDNTGRIIIRGLNDEIYSVEEIVAPSGYLLEIQHKDIKLEWGKTKTLIFTNKARPALEIKKIDTITKEPLAGARFKVTKTEDLTVNEYITDETGTILIKNLDEAIYTVEEIIAPDGYILDTQHKEIQLEWGKTKSLIYEDTRKPTLIITKTNGLTYLPIANTTFKVEYEAENGGVVNLGTFRTDAKGQIIIPKANPGWYIITETIAAPGFSLPSNPVTRKYLSPGENAYTNFNVTGPAGDVTGMNIKVTNGNDYILGQEIIDYPLNSLVIRKANAVTGELLAGATFEVRKVTEDVSGNSGTVIGRYTTNNSGVIVITGLEPGGYVVEETKAPINFLISENSQQQTWLKPDGTSISEVTFGNIPYGSIHVTKVDAQTGKPLANARFKVTDGAGAAVGNTNGEYVTNENGEFTVSNVKPGSYVVTEIEAPENYAIDTTPQTVNVGIDGKVYKVSFKNQPAGTLIIRKLDTASKEPLANAEFKVTDAGGNVVGTSNGIFKTDVTGTITISHLPKGSYVIQEIKAPDGYILENQSQTIAIDYGKSYTVDFYNKKMSGLQIIKIDSVTKQPLKHVQFTVYKQSGEVFGRYETDADGVIIIETLAPGWYKVVETKTLDGYVLDDTPKDVEITANQFVKLVFENAPMSGLIIRKIDADTRVPLEGAEFTVKTAGGLLIGVYISGADGTVNIPTLEPGWYTVTETKAPEGYTLGDNVQTVEITNSKTVTLEFRNRPFGSLVIKKVDEISGNPLVGANFEVSKQGGGFVGEYTTGNDGTVSVLSVEPGWYVISETKAPTGYTLDSTAKTVEVKSAVPSTVTFTNKPFSGIEIIKIDAVTNNPLAGATFVVERANGEKIGTFKTDTAGKIIVPDLTEGTYIVSETIAPDGYILNEVPKTVIVTSDKLTTVEFANKPLSGIQIIKIDSISKAPLLGATFTVERDNGEKIGQYKTDAAGKIIVPDLNEGTYIISETVAPDGYMLNETPKTVIVTSGKLTTVEFANKPFTGIQIIKIDSISKAPLLGATFTVKRDNGEKVGQYKTDAAGKVIVSDLTEGTYVVSETVAPKDYVLNDTPKTVVVKSGKLTTVEFQNMPYSSIVIKKVDEISGVPLAGAIFEIKQQSGDFIGEFTTNTSGLINVTSIEPGWYVITEIKAPDGYILDKAVKTVEVKTSIPTNLTFTNKPLSGIQIIKIDAISKAPLLGATFIVERDNGEKIGQYKTDAAGKILVPDLTEGTYIVSETIAPNGYTRDEVPKTVIVKSGKLTTVEFANKPLSGIEIIKIDAISKAPLLGATFIVERDNGEKIGQYKTDAAGKIIVPNLTEGTYVVSETIAPDGYIRDEAPKTVIVQSGKLTTVEFSNKPLSGIQIIKINSISKAPLLGATFIVERDNGEKIGQYKTDAAGKIIVPNLTEGTYVVSETIAPDGYIRDEAPKTVIVQSGKLTTVEFSNKPLSGIQIIKIDSISKAPLLGATFTVERDNGKKIGQYKTDVAGKIIVPNLTEGTYVVSETIAPDGYIRDEVPKTIIVQSGKLTTVEFANKPFSGIQIIKIDSITKAPLLGATFIVERDNGEKIGQYKTDATGKVIVPELTEGTYIVSEINAPDGYILDEAPKTVIVKSGKLSTVEFTNRPLAGLKIIKLNSENRQPIEGVEFAITKMSGEKVENDFRGYTFKTDKTGQIYIPNLTDGYYTVTETRSAEGYLLDSEPKTVLIQSGKPTIIEVLNKPMSGLLIVKIDANTGKPLKGVVFDIKRADGSFVAGTIIDGNQPNTAYNSPNKTTSPNGDITGSYTTDANGRILINSIEAGQYMVIERKALEGYELDTDVHNVTVVHGKLSTLQVTNKPKAGLRLLKIDSISKKPIYGVEFMVFDMNNKVVGTYHTDNNGIIDFTNILSEGRYTIRETRAAQGYYLDEMPKTVEFVAGKVTEIIWTNTPQMGQLQILKKSGDGNEVNGLPAGTPLEGAIFEVYSYKSGNLVDRFVSGSDGKAVSSPLPLGRYIVKEVQAPKYYKLSDKQLDIEVEFATQIIKQEFLNYSANTGVHIKKTGNIEAMPGDIIRYDIKAVQNTSTVPLTDFFWRDVIPVDAARLTKIVTGTYNQSLKYKIIATTNKGDTRVIADNLSTTQNNVIDCSNASLGLRNDEFVINVTLVFGTVKAGFAQVEQPQIYIQVLKTLPNAYQFANKCDVGGKFGGEWVIGNSTWLTTIYTNPGRLPKTGY